MAKVTMTFLDEAETPEGDIAMGLTTTIEMAGGDYAKSIDSPSVIIALGLLRLLDNEEFVRGIVAATTTDRSAFFEQLRQICGLQKVEVADGQ